MELSTEQEHDIFFSEVARIRDMVRHLNRDIDNGKEPDGPYPASYREDRGARMTLKRARVRLHHVDAALSQLTIKLADHS